jgi:DNA-binding CsgD family transcriptional regulator
MPTPPPVACPDLTKRQKQIVALVSRGHSNREIGAALAVSEHTIRSTLYKLSKRTGARDRAHLVTLAAASDQIDITDAQPATSRKRGTTRA